jgi:nicotinic acid mononucleotide adenylyltransferase
MAKDTFNDHEKYELVGGFFSPVSDQYAKVGLIGAKHRVKMCQLGAADSEWVMVDDWESLQQEYQRTVKVLQHFDSELNEKKGGILDTQGT